MTLFTFLGGLTTYLSWVKHDSYPITKYTLMKIKNFFVPYAIATAVYMIYNEHKLNLINYFNGLIHFNLIGPFYFVLYYMQLILISGVLYKAIKWTTKRKMSKFLFLMEIIIATLLSCICIKYTYILPVHCGGQFLFGGTYLVVFFCGMIIAAYYNRIKWTKLNSAIISTISLIAVILWIIFIWNNKLTLDKNLRVFGEGFNPPGISLFIYAFLILIFGWSFDALIEQYDMKILMRIESFFAKFGKHTMYIFLYHILVICVLNLIGLQNILTNIWIKRIVYFLCIIFVPIVIEFIIENLRKMIVRLIHYSEEEKYGVHE